MKIKNHNQGFMRLIGLLVFAFLIFAFFRIDFKSAWNNPQFQKNLNFIETSAENIWHSYFEKPALYFFNNIFLNNFEDSFKNSFQNKAQPSTSPQGVAPTGSQR